MAGEFIQVVLPWLPSLLTLAGWYLVNHQNNTRERRKDARNAADRCKTLARESAQLAIKYWKDDQADVSAFQLRAALEELEVELRRFPTKKGRKELNEKYADLVDFITGDDFDTADRQQKLAGHSLMKGISRTRQAFLHEVEAQFEKHYH
jgi:hypothetical protein